jgi:hypothetical protein
LSLVTSLVTEKKRVQFRTPRGLVDRADALAAVFETDRTDILITALREYLRDVAHSDEVNQEFADAFYDDAITFEELKGLVGHEEAANFDCRESISPTSSWTGAQRSWPTRRRFCSSPTRLPS